MNRCEVEELKELNDVMLSSNNEKARMNELANVVFKSTFLFLQNQKEAIRTHDEMLYDSMHLCFATQYYDKKYDWKAYTDDISEATVGAARRDPIDPEVEAAFAAMDLYSL